MVTKFTLTSGGIETALDSQSLKNWGDVMCSYSRSDYGGIVRKFTSAFEFTLEAYDYLMALYLEKGFKAECVLAIYTLNDDWSFSKQFECPLDFSTIKWTDTVLSISSVDNSLAALIKANKSTKYELEVGTDIVSDGTFHFDRLLMQESATYEFTQGESNEENGSIRVTVDAEEEIVWLGNVGNEINVGGTILYKDDQDADEDGYLLQAFKVVAVDFSWNLVVDSNSLNNRGSVARNFNIQVLRGSSVVIDQYIFTLGNESSGYTYQGTFSDIASVESAYPGSWDTRDYWVIIDNIVWVVTNNGHGGYWRNTGQSAFEFFRKTYKGSLQLTLLNGDKVRIVCKQDTGKRHNTIFTLYSQSLVFSWKSRGDLCDISSFKPKTLAETLIKKMAGSDLRVEVSISDFDLRLAKTILMAAESVRGIDGAKLYSSFNEFTEWMSAVFGYIYEIGVRQVSPYDEIVNIGECFYTQKDFVASRYTGDVDLARVVYMSSRGMFFYNAPDGNYYIAWDGYLDYVSSSSRPKPGILYNFSNIGLCVFDFNDDGSLASNTPVASGLTTDNALLDWQTVKFLHRSELFNGVVSKDIGNVLDLSYSVTSSSIYSTIEAGYEQKDYDSINGRDEFNFTNVYFTGCTATDKKLSLISKYRADCYGLEFAAQKRGEDTTDSTSDNDVFFVYCSVSGTDYSPARSCSIENALSATVFNGEFSPMACVRANAGYIGMQEADMVLAFASATGNSSIVIDGESLSSDLTLGEALMTCGVIEFTTDDQEVTANLNNAVRLKSNGIEYVGYISDLDLKYARPEPASYKLLVKSISLS